MRLLTFPDAIKLIVKLLQKYPLLKCHIVHLSAHSAIPIIRHAQKELKLPLTVETCFHYLTLVSEGKPSHPTSRGGSIDVDPCVYAHAAYRNTKGTPRI